ncbi:conjugal transfer protein MobB [Spirosoma arcticum]
MGKPLNRLSMVTRISSGSSPAGAVFYNEQKVGKGEAERLAVRNFDAVQVPSEKLTATMVADKLEYRAARSERIKLPTFHASLSLAKGERVGVNDLIAIADQYMQGMGYGKQPYAVYQHHDTEHPHVHIVSVRVNELGRKISDKFEREKSNQLRQQIEKEFCLQVAEKVALRPERMELKPVEYGKGDLKADISAVVQSVLRDFTFSSFSQYNQLLKVYNVQAVEIPMEGLKPGLKYSAINTEGIAQGAAIKASSLPHRPTREVVERRINAGKKIKGDRVSRLRKVAEPVLLQSRTWDDFQQRLSKVGIELMPHLGKDGNLFGVSYVDTRQRAIYTGSELGKPYTAASLKASLGETYQAPTLRQVRAERGEGDSSFQRQTTNQSQSTTHQRPDPEYAPNQRQAEESPSAHVELMRQMLNALSDGNTINDNEHELKKMLKKSRLKPRLS